MHSWLLTTLRLACPVAAVGLPLLMLYGALVPWQVAEDTLIEHRGSSKLLLGSSSHWHSGNGHQSETTSRTYLIIPYSLSTFNAVTVVSTNGRVEVASSHFALLAILAGYALSVYGSWWFWVRPAKQPGNIQHRR